MTGLTERASFSFFAFKWKQKMLNEDLDLFNPCVSVALLWAAPFTDLGSGLKSQREEKPGAELQMFEQAHRCSDHRDSAEEERSSQTIRVFFTSNVLFVSFRLTKQSNMQWTTWSTLVLVFTYFDIWDFKFLVHIFFSFSLVFSIFHQC